MVDVTTLRREHAEQRTVIAQLHAVIEKLTTQLAQMNERMTELLAAAQRKQRKTSDKPAVQQPPPKLAADAQRSFDERPKPPSKPEAPAKTAKPPCTGKRTRRARAIRPTNEHADWVKPGGASRGRPRPYTGEGGHDDVVLFNVNHVRQPGGLGRPMRPA